MILLEWIKWKKLLFLKMNFALNDLLNTEFVKTLSYKDLNSSNDKILTETIIYKQSALCYKFNTI
jgi:hypothetical protein